MTLKPFAFVAAIVAALGLAGCGAGTGGFDPLLAITQADDDTAGPKDPPVVAGHQKIGKPYKVGGRWYTPKHEPNYDKSGMASWYGPGFHGKRTANGEIFNQNALTAAHPTLPLPSYVRVTNRENGKSVVVRVNDRGPFARNRIIDVSKRVSDELGFRHQGHARVRVQYLGDAPLKGGDRETRQAAKKFGDGKGGVGRLRSLIPFGGNKDKDKGGVEVQLAAAEPARTERRQTRRAIPGIPQQQTVVADPRQTRVAAAGEPPVGASNAYVAQAPVEDPIEPLLKRAEAQSAPAAVSAPVEPLPETAVAQSSARVGGAFDMFSNPQ